MTTMTAGKTNTYEAIKALQAGQLDKANEYASAALALEADQIDIRSRVLAAAILMVEIEADAKALMNMAVYNDMVDFVAEVEAQQPKGKCLIEAHIKGEALTRKIKILDENIKAIALKIESVNRMTPKAKADIAETIYDMIDDHDSSVTRLVARELLLLLQEPKSYRVECAFHLKYSNQSFHGHFVRHREEDSDSQNNNVYKTVEKVVDAYCAGSNDIARDIRESLKYSMFGEISFGDSIACMIAYVASNPILLSVETAEFLAVEDYREYGKQLIG